MNKPQLIFATHNPNKLAEAKQILRDYYEVVGLSELGFHDEIPETASTIHGNAALKAQAIWDRFGMPCFSDDTGLMVDALGGAPGVYSARYAGPEANAAANMEKLLGELRDSNHRTARFVTVIAFIREGVLHPFIGEVEGEIVRDPRGDAGFGYDPIFKPTQSDLTFAQMKPEEKHALSHRGRALKKFLAYLDSTSPAS